MPTAEAIEQAKIALRNFRSLQPVLTQYARMLTGRPDVRVVAHERSNGQTDGKVIYFRPPISLGKQIAHQSWKCDKRDKTGQMKCKSCAQREDVLATIYHEIAHIWFNSFDELSEDAKMRAIHEAVVEHGSVYADKIKARIQGMPSFAGYMGLASTVSPFMPTLLNALEDARVNRKLFEALPGTKVMFDANTAKIFCEGVEQLDHTGAWEHQKWSDRPLNMQALIGVFCMASGYNFSAWLNEYVVTSLSDDTLVGLVRKLDEARSVENTFTVAFPILARLRELGFCRTEEDPEDDFIPPFDEEPGDSDDASDDEADDADSSPESGTGESEPSDEPAESGDDAGDDEEVPGDYDQDSSAGDDEPETGSEGDDSEPSDDGDPGDESGAGDDAGEPDEEGELDEDPDGGDPSDGSADGSTSDGEEPGESAGSDGPGDSDSPADGADEDEDEVPEADNDSDDGAGSSGLPSDPGDLRDGDGDDSGDDELDGPDNPGTGESIPDEPGSPVGSVDESESRPESGDEAETSELGEEPVDLGADRKAIRVEGEVKRPIKPDLPWGNAEETRVAIVELGDHAPESVHTHDDDDDETPHVHTHATDEEGDEAVRMALVAGAYFEQPSSVVTGINFHNDASGYFTDNYDDMPEKMRVVYGVDGEFDAAGTVVNPVVTRARIVFADNARGRNELGLKRGRVHSPSLGMKAPIGDPTMFRQRTLPQRLDYFVGIGIDVSGSTTGANIVLAKQVAFAEAEVLSRLGIPFFMYAHHGIPNWDDETVPVDIVEIKTSGEPWNDTTRARLRRLQPGACNLDGHTIQFYRKVLERQRAKRKIMHYYSDGAMPAENHDEELEILQKEIQIYKKQGILLSGVGIRCDSPRQHGLHTVQVDEQSDVMKVIVDLEKQLTRMR